MEIIKNVVLGIITARGGSKSIPLKNIYPVACKPLMAYNLTAARNCRSLSRLICSTDHEAIAAVARQFDCEIMPRPEELAGDMVPSIDVVTDIVSTLLRNEGHIAEYIALLQPTSIFLNSSHIDETVNALRNAPFAKSAQTVAPVPHIYHAFNQRVMSDDGKDMWFAFPKERENTFNKQSKPVYYSPGNLIVTRTMALMTERSFFPRPSLPIVVDRYAVYDLDGLEDIELAELIIDKKLVKLD